MVGVCGSNRRLEIGLSATLTRLLGDAGLAHLDLKLFAFLQTDFAS